MDKRTIICPLLHMHYRMLPVSPPAYRKRRMLPASPPACQIHRKLFHKLQLHLLLPSLSNQINLKVPY
jgi:hypothetical protein